MKLNISSDDRFTLILIYLQLAILVVLLYPILSTAVLPTAITKILYVWVWGYGLFTIVAHSVVVFLHKLFMSGDILSMAMVEELKEIRSNSNNKTRIGKFNEKYLTPFWRVAVVVLLYFNSLPIYAIICLGLFLISSITDVSIKNVYKLMD